MCTVCQASYIEHRFCALHGKAGGASVFQRKGFEWGEGRLVGLKNALGERGGQILGIFLINNIKIY